MIELTQEFGFDAAHFLGAGTAENQRLHGHSFYVEVTLRGEPDAATGFLRDLGEVKAALERVREGLDHRLLNEVEGLGAPTLENLARYIYVRAKASLPEVARVKIRRPSYGQTCVYEERA
jgi:6-pyruvoyltetrahydropterin/6-carboxytetrahydropterin synthase